jgi:phosphatidylserine/phosphatidylglycerophosphate/cardiolipin synthase-like enzyme
LELALPVDIPSFEVVQETERNELRTQSEIQQTTEKLRTTENESERRILQERLKEAEKKLREIEGEKKKRRVRQVYVYEHPRLLEKALTKSQKRVLIISPWIRAQVVDSSFMDKLKAALRRGVAVYIGYGYPEDRKEKDEPRPSDKIAEENLHRLAKQFKNLTVCRLGDTHAKVLISDSNFIVTGSFNWLSFCGDPGRGFRDEQGTLVEIPEHIDDVFREQMKRFGIPIDGEAPSSAESVLE